MTKQSTRIHRSGWAAGEEPAPGPILLGESLIEQRVHELAQRITDDYAAAGCDPLLVIGVLNGAVFFVADLLRAMRLPCQLDFVATSSYDLGRRSTGNVQILKDVAVDLRDRDVLVVEDIIDTGRTLNALVDLFGRRHPRSLSVSVLLDKPARREIDVQVQYVGFEIPNEFVVGYGLDDAGRYRNLPFIASLTGS